MTSPSPPVEFFVARDVTLDCGITVPELRLAYTVTGAIRRHPPVLTCSAFSQTHADLAYLAEPGGPLDPAKRAVIRTELLGNGRSSSPSNTPKPFAGPDFPPITIRDNVRLQSRLLDHLGVGRVAAVIGASMGGQQALQWAVSFPERVGSAVAIAATARTTFYGQLFLHTVRSALVGDPAFAGGRYDAPPLEGLSRMSETWGAFALSPRFFSTGRFRNHADMAADDLGGFLAKWRTRYHTKDANDLLSHLAMWHAHDVAAGGDLATAAAHATMPVLFLPISTDIYFHPDDVRDQAAAFPRATVQVIDSLCGHAAAFGREPEDRRAVAGAIEAFLTGLGA